VAILPSTSSATIDPDPDSMGFYFDTGAEMPCVDGVENMDTLTIYLILTNPTAQEIFGWEAGYDTVGDIALLSTEINCPSACCMSVGGPQNLIIGFGVPLPTSEALILAEITILYMNEELAPVDFILHGTEPSSLDPAYPTILLAEGVLQSTGISSAGGSMAQINGGCSVVSVEPLKFEYIKALYRQ